MKLYPFHKKRLNKRIFQRRKTNDIKALKDTLRNISSGKKEDDFFSNFQEVFSKRMITQSRNIQSRNVSGLVNQFFNISGFSSLAEGNFLTNIIGGFIKNNINSSLQSQFSDRNKNSIFNSTEDQIAEKILRQLQKSKRNL